MKLHTDIQFFEAFPVNSSIKVEKTQLICQLITNLAQHEKIVLEAKVGYLKKARELLVDRVAQIDAGKPFDLTFSLPRLADHSREYKTAIEMLKWSVDGEVVLQPQEFKSLVLNQWSWQESFLRDSTLYSATASGCLASLGLN